MINMKSIAIAGGSIVLAAGAGIYMQMGALPASAPMHEAEMAVETATSDGMTKPQAGATASPAMDDTLDTAAVGLTVDGTQDQPAAIDMSALPDEVDTPAPLSAQMADEQDAQQDGQPVELASISLTSAAVMADLPRGTDLPMDPTPVAADGDDIPNPDTAELSEPKATDNCLVDMTGETRAAAMMALRLSAPCQPNARVSVQHGNLTFTVATDDAGVVEFDMPALSEKSLVIATMDDGNAAAVELMVDTLAFYDRAVVQWTGDTGIELHAREFGADYDSDGHVWSGAPRDATVAARGIGGFITTLGDPSVDNAKLAEVYTFPTGTATTQGDIELTVEVAVTEGNCARSITAQVIDVSEGIVDKLSELDVTLPDCDAVGDYLLLKNLVEDLKIAAK